MFQSEGQGRGPLGFFTASVTSDVEQRTDWNYEYNAKLAPTAENNGFTYALSQVRYEASYGAEYQHESTSFSLALLLATQTLKVIAAVHPGLWQPGVLAKLGATADHLSNARFAVNVVSGWFRDEFTHLGEPWLEHDERYRRSAEFLQVLRKTWTEDDVDFYRIHDFTLKPKPLNTPERPNPEIFQGRNSTSDKRGMRADSTFQDLVQYNDGFQTQLIGTPEQIAERVAAYRKRGVDLILGGFLHFQEEIEYFGSRVVALVREIEDSEEDSIGEPVLASA